MALPKTYADGTEVKEYPKMIYKEDGSKVIIHSAEEEVEVTEKSEEVDTKSKAKKPAWNK